jgi:hypothetical protein
MQPSAKLVNRKEIRNKNEVLAKFEESFFFIVPQVLLHDTNWFFFFSKDLIITTLDENRNFE